MELFPLGDCPQIYSSLIRAVQVSRNLALPEDFWTLKNMFMIAAKLDFEFVNHFYRDDCMLVDTHACSHMAYSQVHLHGTAAEMPLFCFHSLLFLYNHWLRD